MGLPPARLSFTRGIGDDGQLLELLVASDDPRQRLAVALEDGEVVDGDRQRIVDFVSDAGDDHSQPAEFLAWSFRPCGA